MSIGHVIGLLRGSTSFPIIGITLNPADKSSVITLTNANMTAQKSGAVAWKSVRATQPRIAGKYYFEVVFNTFTEAYGHAGFSRP